MILTDPRPNSVCFPFRISAQHETTVTNAGASAGHPQSAVEKDTFLGLPMNEIAGLNARHYARTQCNAIIMYLQKSIWPYPLILDYGWPIALILEQYILNALLLLGILFISGVAFWRWPRIGFLPVCFVVILAPSSSFLVIVTEVMAEHRMYVPLAAMVVLVVLLVFHVGQFIVHVSGWTTKPIVGTVGILLILAASCLGYRTWVQNSLYETAENMWLYNETWMPNNPRVVNNIGAILHTQDRQQEALEYFLRAEDIARSYRVPWQVKLDSAMENAGTAYYDLGEYQKTVNYLSQVIPAAPERLSNYLTMGAALDKLGRPQDAIEAFREALRRNPNFDQAHYNIISVIIDMGRNDDALMQFSKAKRLPPDNPTLIRSFINTLKKLGHTVSYSSLEQRAVLLQEMVKNQRDVKDNPESSESQSRLAFTFLKLGRLDATEAQYSEAVRRRPNDAGLRNDLGTVFYKRGTMDEAIYQFRRATQVDSQHAEARYNLGKSLLEADDLDAAIKYLKEAWALKPNMKNVQDDLDRARKRKKQGQN